MMHPITNKIKAKGWSVVDACKRWSLQPSTFYLWIHREDRKYFLEDAVNGLPTR